ncbi:hypothetical protein [Flavobacterium chungbukense]|uniref:Uncharacterized protein n=1 Tax=Flavobacterium chungbukense TaxID=877464 RepID=A0ABP7YEJ4_9FLAO|nr:hypothetical protein [Flavobacterium chungbukense]MCC4920529.1 hypothetical protein [Flavobacterium chungbukense]
MKNAAEKKENHNCPASRSRLFSGENNELIYIKSYNGDWGDWDEKSVNENISADPAAENSSSKDTEISDLE